MIYESSSHDIGYTGRKSDNDLGLSYMQARYYDPVIGRFYSNDPIGFRDVHSFNRYAYANNNPYKYVDPDGQNPERTKIGPRVSPFPDPTGQAKRNEEIAKALERAIRNSVESISNVFNESTDTPENAAQGLPDLTGIDGEIAEETLGENGFTKKPTSTAGGYQEWKHKDGSRVFVRPNGEVIRQGPNRPRRGHPNARWVRDRYGPNGEHIPHDPGNETHNTGEIINI